MEKKFKKRHNEGEKLTGRTEGFSQKYLFSFEWLILKLSLHFSEKYSQYFWGLVDTCQKKFDLRFHSSTSLPVLTGAVTKPILLCP